VSAEPSGPEDWATLEAGLREAIQHRRAALERVRETQAELEALIERARRLLAAGAEPPEGPDR
jgi:hypothetical protein